jgi:hypothetical protein
MRMTLALILVVGLSFAVAKADAKSPSPATLSPANDSRLAKRRDAQPQKIGVLSFYPNNGGGYTFVEGTDIVFYALPCIPTTYKVEGQTAICQDIGNGETVWVHVPVTFDVPTLGPSTIPLGGPNYLPTRDGSERQRWLVPQRHSASPLEPGYSRWPI